MNYKFIHGTFMKDSVLYQLHLIPSFSLIGGFTFRMDATLREITGLVKEVNPDARNKGTYFDFSLVSPEVRNSGYRMREIGVTCSGQKGADDNKTLSQARYLYLIMYSYSYYPRVSLKD